MQISQFVGREALPDADFAQNLSRFNPVLGSGKQYRVISL